jgi:hypothetical protein
MSICRLLKSTQRSRLETKQFTLLGANDLISVLCATFVISVAPW